MGSHRAITAGSIAKGLWRLSLGRITYYVHTHAAYTLNTHTVPGCDPMLGFFEGDKSQTFPAAVAAVIPERWGRTTN